MTYVPAFKSLELAATATATTSPSQAIEALSAVRPVQCVGAPSRPPRNPPRRLHAGHLSTVRHDGTSNRVPLATNQPPTPPSLFKPACTNSIAAAGAPPLLRFHPDLVPANHASLRSSAATLNRPPLLTYMYHHSHLYLRCGAGRHRPRSPPTHPNVTGE